MMNRDILETAFLMSRKSSLSDELETVVSLEEKNSLESPGVPSYHYRFFDSLVSMVAPLNVLELGTYTGVSAYCLADKNVGGHVTTVDHKNERIFDVCRKVPNIQMIHSDSLVKVNIDRIDILFLDTLHDGIRCVKEFEMYEDKVVPGGVIFFDDIHLNEDMRKFWKSFKPSGYEKFELPLHGAAGFGVLIKQAKEEDEDFA